MDNRTPDPSVLFHLESRYVSGLPSDVVSGLSGRSRSRSRSVDDYLVNKKTSDADLSCSDCPTDSQIRDGLMGSFGVRVCYSGDVVPFFRRRDRT